MRVAKLFTRMRLDRDSYHNALKRLNIYVRCLSKAMTRIDHGELKLDAVIGFSGKFELSIYDE